jgi:hypothetical protein
MGLKSRGNYAVMECIGCVDVNTRRCKDCLGRPQDKRRVDVTIQKSKDRVSKVR